MVKSVFVVREYINNEIAIPPVNKAAIKTALGSYYEQVNEIYNKFYLPYSFNIM